MSDIKKKNIEDFIKNIPQELQTKAINQKQSQEDLEQVCTKIALEILNTEGIKFSANTKINLLTLNLNYNLKDDNAIDFLKNLKQYLYSHDKQYLHNMQQNINEEKIKDKKDKVITNILNNYFKENKTTIEENILMKKVFNSLGLSHNSIENKVNKNSGIIDSYMENKVNNNTKSIVDTINLYDDNQSINKDNIEL